MIKLSGDLTKALSTIKDSNYLKLDLSECTTKGNKFYTNMIPEKILSKIVTLILPNTIEVISNLDCKTLNKLIGYNVLRIDDNAFEYCKLLRSVNFPKVESIGADAFYGCRKSLVLIKLPNVTTISNYAFNGCASLKSIDLPKMHEINKKVFVGCKSLETINLFKYHIEEFLPGVSGELYD